MEYIVLSTQYMACPDVPEPGRVTQGGTGARGCRPATGQVWSWRRVGRARTRRMVIAVIAIPEAQMPKETP